MSVPTNGFTVILVHMAKKDLEHVCLSLEHSAGGLLCCGRIR